MESNSTCRIRFLKSSPAEANAHAADLATYLRNTIRNDVLQVERERTTKDAQDFGATVVLILGTAAAGAVARGIQAWLAKSGTSIEITDEHGSLIATNVDSNSAASIVKTWSERGDKG